MALDQTSSEIMMELFGIEKKSFIDMVRKNGEKFDEITIVSVNNFIGDNLIHYGFYLNELAKLYKIRVNFLSPVSHLIRKTNFVNPITISVPLKYMSKKEMKLLLEFLEKIKNSEITDEKSFIKNFRESYYRVFEGLLVQKTSSILKTKVSPKSLVFYDQNSRLLDIFSLVESSIQKILSEYQGFKYINFVNSLHQETADLLRNKFYSETIPHSLVDKTTRFLFCENAKRVTLISDQQQFKYSQKTTSLFNSNLFSHQIERKVSDSTKPRPTTFETVYELTHFLKKLQLGIGDFDLDPSFFQGSDIEISDLPENLRKSFEKLDGNYMIINLNTGSSAKNYEFMSIDYLNTIKVIINTVRTKNPNMNFFVVEPHKLITNEIRNRVDEFIGSKKHVEILKNDDIAFWGPLIRHASGVMSHDSGFVHISNLYLASEDVFTFGIRNAYEHPDPKVTGPNFWRHKNNLYYMADSIEDLHQHIKSKFSTRVWNLTAPITFCSRK